MGSADRRRAGFGHLTIALLALLLARVGFTIARGVMSEMLWGSFAELDPEQAMVWFRTMALVSLGIDAVITVWIGVSLWGLWRGGARYTVSLACAALYLFASAALALGWLVEMGPQLSQSFFMVVGTAALLTFFGVAASMGLGFARGLRVAGKRQSPLPVVAMGLGAVWLVFVHGRNLLGFEPLPFFSNQILLSATMIASDAALLIPPALLAWRMGAVDPESASGDLQRDDDKGRGLRNLLLGAVWLVGGTVVTVATSGAASGGGQYVVAYGAIVGGFVQMIIGIVQLSASRPGPQP